MIPVVGGAREAAAALLELEANNCEHEKDAVTQSQLLKPCMGMVDDTTNLLDRAHEATIIVPLVVCSLIASRDCCCSDMMSRC
jgi:hypothetical protein